MGQQDARFSGTVRVIFRREHRDLGAKRSHSRIPDAGFTALRYAGRAEQERNRDPMLKTYLRLGRLSSISKLWPNVPLANAVLTPEAFRP